MSHTCSLSPDRWSCSCVAGVTLSCFFPAADLGVHRFLLLNVTGDQRLKVRGGRQTVLTRGRGVRGWGGEHRKTWGTRKMRNYRGIMGISWTLPPSPSLSLPHLSPAAEMTSQTQWNLLRSADRVSMCLNGLCIDKHQTSTFSSSLLPTLVVRVFSLKRFFALADLLKHLFWLQVRRTCEKTEDDVEEETF